MMAAPITLTYSRASALDFSFPIAITERSFIWYRPEGGADFLGFIKPFTIDVRNKV